MAIYQTAIHHDDTVQKRPITESDLNFLKTLQNELNTQDTMGNADPRFWVIAGQKFVETPDGTAHGFLSADGEYAGDTVQEAINFIKTNELFAWKTDPNNDRHTVYRTMNNDCRNEIQFQDNTYIIRQPKPTLAKHEEYPENMVSTTHNLKTLDDVLTMLTYLDIEGYSIIYGYFEHHIYPDTLFLTHKAAEDHLRRYHYNYDKDAHAYAMTAVRSPEYETLLKIIQNVDINQIQAKLCL